MLRVVCDNITKRLKDSLFKKPCEKFGVEIEFFVYQISFFELGDIIFDQLIRVREKMVSES